MNREIEKFLDEVRLTDEEIIELVTEYHMSGVQNRHVLAEKVAKAAQNKILKHKDEEGRPDVCLVDRTIPLVGPGQDEYARRPEYRVIPLSEEVENGS